MNRAYFAALARAAAVLAVAVVASGCGDSAESDCADGGTCPADAAAPGPCTFRFAGNYEGTSTTTTPCASLAKGKDDAWTLKMTGPVSTKILIDLGRTPTTGEFSSETVETWSATGGVSGVGTGPCSTVGSNCELVCEYSAGNDSAPQGNFTLALSAIDVNASEPVAHGQLEVTQDVHASPFADCGRGDTEEIQVDF